MAEALAKRALPDMTIFSAGIDALSGEPADPFSVRLMRERGIDIGAHRARCLGAWMVSDADLILTMDHDQRRFVERKFPAARNKVFRLGEFDNYDIPDPYQQGFPAFLDSYKLIAHGVDELVARIDHIREEGSGSDIATIQCSP